MMFSIDGWSLIIGIVLAMFLISFGKVLAANSAAKKGKTVPVVLTANNINEQMQDAIAQQFDLLYAAGTALYEAGYWTCDRDSNEEKLWTEFRDALGRSPGTSPKRKF